VPYLQLRFGIDLLQLSFNRSNGFEEGPRHAQSGH